MSRVAVVALVLVVVCAGLAEAARIDKLRHRMHAKAKAPTDWDISNDQYGASANPVFKAVSQAQQTITKRKYQHGFFAWKKTKALKLKLAANEAVAAKLVQAGPDADREWTALEHIFAHCPAYVPKPYDRFPKPPNEEYQITEALTGPNLATYAVANWGLLKAVGKTLLKGLDCMHTKALYLHRDVKLPNVLLDASNNPRFIDFGEALPIASDWASNAMDGYTMQQTAQYEPWWGPPSCNGGHCSAAMRVASEVSAVGIILLQSLYGTGTHDILVGLGMPANAFGANAYGAAYKTFFQNAGEITTKLSGLAAILHTPAVPQTPELAQFASALALMCNNQAVTAAQALAHPFFA